ncbi:MAG TPA: tRNA (adenosine(37)-N6)-dimethylallyltransferase MiaA, partial [Methylomirabilota bacterium]|nr:tRNA (adenosine(37)-N6)-dimethylallyltransferase MiaA [Methylomirabilota bacterium]
VGPTGIGKTAVAGRLAQRVAMEAVSADSRQVYRGMDIGTGKPTPQERAALPHHLLDVVDPDERYHAARFRREALASIGEIRRRGRLAAVVGGTGLYVRALLKGLVPAPPADPALRRELEQFVRARGAPALHARLAGVAPDAAARLHPNDRVRIVRALEIHLRAGASAAAGPAGEGSWRGGAPDHRLLMVGLRQSRERLNQRLAERAREMVARGMMEEVRRLLEAGYGSELPSMGGIGYRQFSAVLRGRMTEDEALRLMIRDTQRYAKRQLTWFRQDPEIRWLDVDQAGGLEGTADAVYKLMMEEGLIE